MTKINKKTISILALLFTLTISLQAETSLNTGDTSSSNETSISKTPTEGVKHIWDETNEEWIQIAIPFPIGKTRAEVDWDETKEQWLIKDIFILGRDRRNEPEKLSTIISTSESTTTNPNGSQTIIQSLPDGGKSYTKIRPDGTVVKGFKDQFGKPIISFFTGRIISKQEAIDKHGWGDTAAKPEPTSTPTPTPTPQQTPITKPAPQEIFILGRNNRNEPEKIYKIISTSENTAIKPNGRKIITQPLANGEISYTIIRTDGTVAEAKRDRFGKPKLSFFTGTIVSKQEAIDKYGWTQN